MKIDKKLMRQILLYGLIGGGSALLDFAVFSLLHKLFGINEFIANIISVHAGIAMSFTLNRRYNFKKADKVLFRGASFYFTGLLGLALSEGLILFGRWLALSVMLVKFVSIFIVAAFQFVINKLVAFGK